MKPRRSILICLSVALFGFGAALATSHPGGQVALPASILESAIRTGFSQDPDAELASAGAARAAERRSLPDPPPEHRTADRGPVLLAGRVTDDLGQAIDGMRVIATPLVDIDLPPRGVSGELAARLHAAERERRARDSSATVLYREDGSFEVRGWTSAMRFTLRAQGKGRSISGEFRRGTLDVAVVFEPVGKVHALISHDRGISGRAFDVLLRSNDGRPPIRLWVSHYQRAGQHLFEHHKVPVGIHTLEVRLHGTRDPLFLLHGIEVRRNARCSDQRLNNIDVSRFCRSVTVTLLRPDGRPLPLPAYVGVEVTARDPHGELLPQQPKLRKSRLAMTTIHDYIDLSVRIRRFREVHLGSLREDCAIRLEPSESEER